MFEFTSQAPDLIAAKDFLIFHADATPEAFATAFILEVHKTHGLYTLPADDQSGTWSSAVADVSLYGISAMGGTPDEAILNWRRVATRLTEQEQADGLAAWAREGLSDPVMRTDPQMRHHAQSTLSQNGDQDWRAA